MSLLRRIISAILSLVEGPATLESVVAALDKKAASQSERLDWRNSVVDLMKLVGMDSSLPAREALATELGYTGELGGTAEMNIWLHQKIMEKLANKRSL